MKKFDFDIGLADDDVELDADLTKQIENIELKAGGGRRPGGNHDTRITSVVSDIGANPYDSVNLRDSMPVGRVMPHLSNVAPLV